jgi:hypothetical protein
MNLQKFLIENPDVVDYTKECASYAFSTLSPELSFGNCYLEISEFYNGNDLAGNYGAGCVSVSIYDIIESSLKFVEQGLSTNLYKCINTIVLNTICHELCHSRQYLLKYLSNYEYRLFVEYENDIETLYQMNRLIDNGIIDTNYIDKNVINHLSKDTVIPKGYTGYDNDPFRLLLYKVIQFSYLDINVLPGDIDTKTINEVEYVISQVSKDHPVYINLNGYQMEFYGEFKDFDDKSKENLLYLIKTYDSVIDKYNCSIHYDFDLRNEEKFIIIKLFVKTTSENPVNYF